MTITTSLMTWLRGAPVGTDAAGNRYFQERRVPSSRRRKRWVLYNGPAEPTRVPPEWHGWLHYTTDVPPTKARQTHYAWEKPQQPNRTGTAEAYLPPGHLNRAAHHAPTTSDYEPWRP